jgi:hypothetical protein
MQSRRKRGRIADNRLRGCGDWQQGQDRVRDDRAKGANPSKVDTFENPIKRHHRCSSMREGLTPNVSHDALYRLRAMSARCESGVFHGRFQLLSSSKRRSSGALPVYEETYWQSALT